MTTPTPTGALRLVVALSAAIAGAAHLKLYADGYKDIPVGNIGEQFLLNAATAAAIATAMVVLVVRRSSPRWLIAGAPAVGAGWAATSLFAFWKARRGDGWFGFRDVPGLNPSPEAHLSVFPEIVALVGCLALLALLAGAVRTAHDRRA